MNTGPVSPQASELEIGEEIDPKLLAAIPNGTIFAYNMGDSETPAGVKLRWKVRVVTGAEAARWDARQAEAIREALTWLHKHHAKTGSP